MTVRIIKEYLQDVAHQVTQPRSQEVYKFLGLWPDIEKEALPVPPMRLYESPEGSKPLKTWHMFEWSDPTPSMPFVSSTVTVGSF